MIACDSIAIDHGGWQRSSRRGGNAFVGDIGTSIGEKIAALGAGLEPAAPTSSTRADIT